jgi:hypothetical protein
MPHRSTNSTNSMSSHRPSKRGGAEVVRVCGGDVCMWSLSPCRAECGLVVCEGERMCGESAGLRLQWERLANVCPTRWIFCCGLDYDRRTRA